MFMISIQKGHHFAGEDNTVVGPFEVFKCSSAFAQKQGARNPKLIAVEDYLGLIAHRPENEIRQLAKNAGLDATLPIGELKQTLREFAVEGEVESREVDLDSLTVNELRKEAAALSISGYAYMRKAELIDAIAEAAQ